MAKCKVCGKWLKNKRALAGHKKKHTRTQKKNSNTLASKDIEQLKRCFSKIQEDIDYLLEAVNYLNFRADANTEAIKRLSYILFGTKELCQVPADGAAIHDDLRISYTKRKNFHPNSRNHQPRHG